MRSPMQLMKLKKFSFKSPITSKIEKFQFALIQPRAQEIFFFNFQHLIAKCTKQTENKWNNLRNDIEREK